MHLGGWTPRRRRLATAMWLLAPLGLIALRAQATGPTTWLADAAAGLSRPLQAATVSAIDGAARVGRRTMALWTLLIDNEALHTQVDRLQAQVLRLEEAAAENTRLRALLALREDVGEPNALVAPVIAVSPVPAFRSLRVGRGALDGVHVGDAVFCAQGLVGRVATVSERSADVVLVVDAQSSVDAIVQRSRARVRVRGEGRDAAFGLEGQYLERTADVEPGDTLLTSGLGHTLPKGLVVGRVRGIERRAFGLYQRVLVQPAADVGRLEEVLVAPTKLSRALAAPPFAPAP